MTTSFVILIIRNSKTNHIGAQGTFYPIACLSVGDVHCDDAGVLGPREKGRGFFMGLTRFSTRAEDDHFIAKWAMNRFF